MNAPPVRRFSHQAAHRQLWEARYGLERAAALLASLRGAMSRPDGSGVPDALHEMIRAVEAARWITESFRERVPIAERAPTKRQAEEGALAVWLLGAAEEAPE